MSKESKAIAGVLLRVLSIILVMETVFYFMTPKQYKDIGYLINIHRATTKVVPPGFGFDEVDPLLGYSKTKSTLQAQGFNVVSNCVLLSTTDDTTGMINILITGGSTSDLSLYPNNWPVKLCAILKEHGIKAKLYCAGVGGYNSGQELLKLIRDGLETGPWVHISYSGANEFFDPSYVSTYEQVFYETEFNKGPGSLLLPNTVLFMRDLLKLKQQVVTLRQNPPAPIVKFWEKNMRLMHGISTENNYRFVGFLQPVMGSGKFHQQIRGHDESIAQYRKLYPELRKAAGEHPDFLVDLTTIFDTCKGNVFMDNCHINDPYQEIVAQNIFTGLVEKKIFNQ